MDGCLSGCCGCGCLLIWPVACGASEHTDRVGGPVARRRTEWPLFPTIFFCLTVTQTATATATGTALLGSASFASATGSVTNMTLPGTHTRDEQRAGSRLRKSSFCVAARGAQAGQVGPLALPAAMLFLPSSASLPLAALSRQERACSASALTSGLFGQRPRHTRQHNTMTQPGTQQTTSSEDEPAALRTRPHCACRCRLALRFSLGRASAGRTC